MFTGPTGNNMTQALNNGTATATNKVWSYHAQDAASLNKNNIDIVGHGTQKSSTSIQKSSNLNRTASQSRFGQKSNNFLTAQ